jgi:hypothetical protein
MNEGYSTTQMVSGLQILSSGFLKRVLRLPQDQFSKQRSLGKPQSIGGGTGQPKVAESCHYPEPKIQPRF